jgi:2'-5' RNA ligase
VALALSLLFDSETGAAVDGLWRELADAGISADMLALNYPPHLTLIVMEDEGLARTLEPALASLAPMAPRELTLGDVVTFAKTDVVYIGLDGDLTQLLALHRAVCDLLPADAVRPYYRPGVWTPHVTLQSVGDADRALTLARASWTARRAVTTRLELATFLPVRVGQGIELG